MKFLYTLIASLFCFIMTAQQPFVTTWEVTAGDLDITIPTNTIDYTYDYTIDFGDGTILNNQTGNVTHTYSTSGIYQVSISGLFPHFYSEDIYNGSNPNLNLKSVDQWGDNQWQSMNSMFYNSHNLTFNATDVPDLLQVTNMRRMFYEAESFNDNINDWDVSNVTDISSSFNGAESFNQPLDNWDVSSVVDMSGMFFRASSFNQPLDNWDVSNVTDISSSFNGAESFNQPLDNWDVSNVTDMHGMFSNSSYNQPLNMWNVSNVTDMRIMFSNYSSYNQPLNNWDVSNVTDMYFMFSHSSYNQPLNNWDVSNVTDMHGMFNNSSYNQPLNNWDVSNVTDMYFMFENSNFNQDINNWDVSNVTHMYRMFQGALFNQPLNNWDVSNVQELDQMFAGAIHFNQPLDNWDVSNVSSAFGFWSMFEDASSFNQDLSNWQFPNGKLPNFADDSGMSIENYDLLIENLVNLDIDNGTLGAENIEYCDTFTRQQLVNAGWTITDAGTANGCDLNYVSGYVLYDQENDGCDASDFDLSNYLINVNNGTDDASFDMDENGQYVIALDSGNYTLSILNLDSNFTSTPTTQTVNFTGQNEIIDDVDLCITTNQQFDDLSVDVFPLEDAIPGFETDYQIIFSNNGTQTVSNYQVTFAYDNNFQSFISATITPSGNTTNLLSFDLTNLEPFSQEVIEITMLNAVPPTLNGGENLNFTAQVTPDVNDINSDDNTAIHDQTVVNSFDPNDKLVIQGDEVADEDKDQYLDYRIRFQNVGSANALNVKITDTISNKLDWTTFQPITSSHNYRVELIDQEEINFIFDNINLPFESADPEGSNGYITYKIKPKSNVQIGDIIENKAYIFFDFNAPIITNTVSTEIVDNLSTTSFVQAENINLSPNPVENQVEIINESNAVIQSLQLYSIKGQLITTFTDKSLIDISSLSSGVYILQVETQHNKINKKLIKR